MSSDFYYLALIVVGLLLIAGFCFSQDSAWARARRRRLNAPVVWNWEFMACWSLALIPVVVVWGTVVIALRG